MELKEFIATKVAAGQPITAEAWNDLVDGITYAHDYLKAQIHVVRVKIENDLDARDVRVTAVRPGKPAIESVRPVTPDGEHMIVGLDEGAYEILAQSAGFADTKKPVNVDASSADSAVSITMAVAQPLMPNLFGEDLEDALSDLAAAGIPVTQILDFAGREIPPASPDAEYLSAPIMAQKPSAGEPVGPQGARLGVAIAVQAQTAIEVPPLTTLTQAEAKKALEKLGLILGEVTILEKE